MPVHAYLILSIRIHAASREQPLTTPPKEPILAPVLTLSRSAIPCQLVCLHVHKGSLSLDHAFL